LIDQKAFLFRLYQDGTFKPVHFPSIGGTNAMYDHPNYGPTFGAGHDLNAFNGTVAHNGTCFPLNGGINFGNSYTMKGENANTICNGNLKVTDFSHNLNRELNHLITKVRSLYCVPDEIKSVLCLNFGFSRTFQFIKFY
jgi:hypothetical protein